MKGPKTIPEFEEWYATNSGLTVQQLHEFGRFGALCDCDEPECHGFKMAHSWEDAIFDDLMRAESGGH